MHASRVNLSACSSPRMARTSLSLFWLPVTNVTTMGAIFAFSSVDGVAAWIVVVTGRRRGVKPGWFLVGVEDLAVPLAAATRSAARMGESDDGACITRVAWSRGHSCAVNQVFGTSARCC